MALLENIKKTTFWFNVMKVGIVFVIFITIISLCFNSFLDLFSGNWEAISDKNFSNQQWKPFFSSKIIAGFIYGIYVSNKNMK
tara:strand:- start:20679 stop:20927 length:249 start_codon:yes stop_codon:yes gene_type:complete